MIADHTVEVPVDRRVSLKNAIRGGSSYELLDRDWSEMTSPTTEIVTVHFKIVDGLGHSDDYRTLLMAFQREGYGIDPCAVAQAVKKLPRKLRRLGVFTFWRGDREHRPNYICWGGKHVMVEEPGFVNNTRRILLAGVRATTTP